MARPITRLLTLLLACAFAGPARSGEPLLGTVVSVDQAEARLVLRVQSDSEERELTLGLGEKSLDEPPRVGQLVRVWVLEDGVAGVEPPVVRSIMTVGGAGRDPTGVRARIGRGSAGRPPGGRGRGR